MIIDCHAHVFKDLSTACDLESTEIHLKYMQKNLTHPNALVKKKKDGSAGDPKTLYRFPDEHWSGLREDIDFRAGSFGRFEWTVEGEDYFVQYLPVNMVRLECPPELLLAHMLYAGVDHCVLQAGPAYGFMNDYNALCQQKYPERFTGLFHVDEPRADEERWMKEIDRAVEQLYLKGLYYQLDSFYRYSFQWEFTDKRFEAFWEKIASKNIPVFFECPPAPGYDEASYIRNMQQLGKLLQKHPQVRWLLVMGPPVRLFAKGGVWNFPAEVEKVYRHPQVQLEVMFPISLGGRWDYPYPEAQALLKDFRDRFGAEKLVWGSDMPMVERFCTYKQCLDYVRQYCHFLSPDDLERILGRNCQELLGISLS